MRQPTPCPRKLPVYITHHGRAQVRARGLTEAHVRDVVTNGREVPTEEIGQKGGYISKFYKSVGVVEGKGSIPKTVVAVCEVFADNYVLLSAYKEQPKIG